MSPAAKAAVILLRLYKVTLSPVLAVLGTRCRHLPTCSDYAAEACRRHGFWPGSWVTLARLCRCHPFGSYGFDPVPQTLNGHPLLPWRYGRWRWSLGDDAWAQEETHEMALKTENTKAGDDLPAG